MKILFLSRWFPLPADNGSKLRIVNLLRGIASEHQVTLISMVDDSNSEPRISELSSWIDEVFCVPLKAFRPNSSRARLALLGPKPRFIVDTYSTDFAREIRRVIAQNNFDLVIASQLDTAMYRDEFGDLPAIFDEVEIAIPYERYVHSTSLTRSVRTGLTWLKHRRYMASLLDRYQVCTVASDSERLLIQEAMGHPGRVEVIPNAIDLASYDNLVIDSPRQHEWIFAGSLSYSPNQEAIDWFAERVLPQVLESLPSFRLMITGKPGRDARPKHSSITMTGFVEDVRPLIAKSWGSVVPLITGGGTRLKILEAMTLRTPVVSTSKGVEGIDAKPERDILIGDEPSEFAQQVVRLSSDVALRRDLAEAGRRLVQLKYDAAAISQKLLRLIAQVAAN